MAWLISGHAILKMMYHQVSRLHLPRSPYSSPSLPIDAPCDSEFNLSFLVHPLKRQGHVSPHIKAHPFELLWSLIQYTFYSRITNGYSMTPKNPISCFVAPKNPLHTPFTDQSYQ